MPDLKPTPPQTKRILVSGAGIAGLTQAYWLAKLGFEVEIIERSAALRDEGYMMDFSAEGIQIADAMGILGDLHDASAGLKAMEFVSASGDRFGGFDISDLQDLMARGNYGYIPLMRGDLERTLADILPAGVSPRYSTSIAGVQDRDTHLEIEFGDGTRECFDLLIVAEGIHSATRALVFGAEENFIRPLNSTVAITRLRGGATEMNWRAKTNIDVGNFVVATPTVDGDVIVVFAFASDQKPPREQDAIKTHLRKRFSGAGTFTRHLLDRITPDTVVFIDQVAQIHNPTWYRGRVALIGDAASCMTLLSGQGSIMAMTQAYVLAQELAKRGDHATAFAAYEKILRPEIEGKMKLAAKVSALIPETRFQLGLFQLTARALRYRFALKTLFRPYLKPTIFNRGYPLGPHL